MRETAGLIGVTALLLVATAAPAAALPEPWPAGPNPTGCATADTSVGGQTTYTDTAAPSLTSLAWLVGSSTRPTLSVGSVGTDPKTGRAVALGGTAAIAAGLVETCSGIGANVVAGAGASPVRGALTYGGRTQMYLMSQARPGGTSFALTAHGPTMKWCPADAGRTAPSAIRVRPRFTAFTLADGSPRTLVAATAPVDDTVVPRGAVAPPVLRTSSRTEITFSSASVRVGGRLTVFAKLTALSSVTSAGPTGMATTASCGAPTRRPIGSVRMTLEQYVPSFTGGFRWVLKKRYPVTTGSLGLASVTVDFPGISKYRWVVAPSAMPAWATASNSPERLITPT